MLSATDEQKLKEAPEVLEQSENELNIAVKAAQEVVKDAKHTFSQQAQAKKAAKAAQPKAEPGTKVKAKAKASAK